ncbi:MAG TPA: VOC family protein [Polyangiaceae bacterium]|jgi:catechol 2,3-dioxygenase-like lactoylglutathione lyase family enzyme|nr:VOC family protein [Polyangiaceae bacterium]
MKLNHLDLQVHDVASTTQFFERYFGLQLQSNANSPALAILTDQSGFVLVLQRSKAGERYPEGFHVGFLLDDVASVRALHARAVADGVPVSDVIVNGRGTIIYLTAPEGYYVEVSCQKHRFGAAPEPSAA